MTAPSNFVAVQGQTAMSADALNTTVQWCPNVATLRTFVGTSNQTVILLGTNALNDGGQGIFYWLPTSPGPDNGTSIIQPTGVTTGAWIRDTVAATTVNIVSSGTVTAQCGQAYVGTGTFTLNLSPSTSLSANCQVFVFAYGGAVTITPLSGTDTINGGSAGASFTLPLGSFCTILTDANGHFYLALTTTLFFWGGTSGGSANAQTVSPGTGFTGGAGQMVGFKAGFSNTASATLNGTTLKVNTASGLANLSGGEIITGNEYLVHYNGTNPVLINPSLSSSAILAQAPSTVSSFFAQKATNQTLSDGVETLIGFATIAVNVGSNYDGVNKWTPPAGTVMVSGQLDFDATGAQDAIIAVYKNGSVAHRQAQHLSADSADGTGGLQITVISVANGTDYFQIYGKTTSGSGGTVIGSGQTFFWGTMI